MKIVHVHVHRTAGTSVQRTLRDWFPGQVTMSYPDEGLVERPIDSVAWIGHQPLTEAPTAEVRSTIIRDPVERVFAHYSFWRDAPLACTNPLYRRLHDENLGILEFAEVTRGWQTHFVKDLTAYTVVGIYSPAGLSNFLRDLAYALDLPSGREHHVSVFNPQKTLDPALRYQLAEIDRIDADLYRHAVETAQRLGRTRSDTASRDVARSLPADRRTP